MTALFTKPGLSISTTLLLCRYILLTGRSTKDTKKHKRKQTKTKSYTYYVDLWKIKNTCLAQFPKVRRTPQDDGFASRKAAQILFAMHFAPWQLCVRLFFDAVILTPYSKLISTRVGKVKTPTAGEIERRFRYFPAVANDSIFRFFQFGRIDHHEHAAAGDRWRLREPSADPAILETRVVGPVVGKLPTKNGRVKIPYRCNIDGGKLYIIDAKIVV